MKWIRAQQDELPSFEFSVVTIGSFDGVHLGHQKLIAELVRAAKKYNTVAVVCTFKPHPRVVLRPSEPHHRLFDYQDQQEMMSVLGVDYLVEEKFSKDFALMSASEFLDTYIKKNFNPKEIVVGHDFSFGKDRTGNFEFLEDYCRVHHIKLTIVDPCIADERAISTSRVRNALEVADLDLAKSLLGRPYYLRGPVRLGYKRGVTIGVPTANISPEIEFTPRKGVYLSYANLDGVRHPSITNIGYNPTFENPDSYLKVETHILNFNQDIYGKQMHLELISFLRDEKKFGNMDSLKLQIYDDIGVAKKYFGVN